MLLFCLIRIYEFALSSVLIEPVGDCRRRRSGVKQGEGPPLVRYACEELVSN
jgi:hypothetical protein